MGRGDMSLEDMSLKDMSREVARSTVSLGAVNGTSVHCNCHSGLEPDIQGQDGAVMKRIASLPVDMFDPSDFTGRFTKIQWPRKRTRIIDRKCKPSGIGVFCENNKVRKQFACRSV